MKVGSINTTCPPNGTYQNGCLGISCSINYYYYYFNNEKLLGPFGVRYPNAEGITANTELLYQDEVEYVNFTLTGLYTACTPGNPEPTQIPAPNYEIDTDIKPGVWVPSKLSPLFTGNFGAEFWIKYTPKQPSSLTIQSSKTTINAGVYCKGEVLTITAANMYRNFNFSVDYIFEAYDENNIVKESYTWRTTIPNIPRWIYTVPDFSANSKMRYLRVKIKGVPTETLPDEDPWESPFLDRRIGFEIYASPPTITGIFTKPPTCSYSGDGEIKLTVAGFCCIGGMTAYQVAAQTTLAGTNENLNLDFRIAGRKDSALYFTGTTFTLSADKLFSRSRLDPGPYRIQIKNYYTDQPKCFETSNVITIPGKADPVISPTYTVPKLGGTNYNVSCLPGRDGKIIVSASGGNGGDYSFGYSATPTSVLGDYFFPWGVSGPSVATFTGLFPDRYYIRARDRLGCVSSNLISADVTLPPPGTITGSVPMLYPGGTAVSCFEAADGRIDVTVGGGSGAGRTTYIFGTDARGNYVSVSDNSGSTNIPFSNFPAGTFTGYFIDNLNCISPTTKIVVNEPPPLSVTGYNASLYNGYEFRCSYNLTDGEVSIAGGGGVTSSLLPDKYYFAVDNINRTTTSNMISNLSFGGHTLFVKDINGCIAQKDINLNNVPPALSVTGIIYSNRNGYNVSCNKGDVGTHDDGSVTVTGAGGIESLGYIFTINGFTNSFTRNRTNTFNDLVEGGHTFSLTDANGCSLGSSFSLNAPPALKIAALSKTEPLCNAQHNGLINLTLSGGVGGVYTCNLALPFGNRKNSYDDNAEYDSTKAFISGGFKRLPAGNYILGFNDRNDCYYTSTIAGIPRQDTTFLLDDPGRIRAENLLGYITCFGLTDGKVDPVVTGGTKPYRYRWTNESSNVVLGTDTILPDRPKGNYKVYITDRHLCDNGKSDWLQESGAWATTVLSGLHGEVFDVAVFGPASPITLSGIQVVDPSCNGDKNGSFSLNANGGWGGFRIDTNKVNLITVDSISRQQFKNLKAGNYKVFARDWHGCLDSASILLNQPEILTLTGLKEDILCFNRKTGQILLTATGGNSGLTYVITSPGFSKTQVVPAFSGLDIGSYVAQVRDSKGCVATTTSFVLTQPSLVVGSVINTKKSSCGEALGEAIVTVIGGVLPYSYLWLNDAVPNFTNAAQNLTSGLYRVLVLDGHNCNHTFSGFVDDVQAPEIGGGILNVPKCSNSSDGVIYITATGSGNLSYTWLESESKESMLKELQGNRAYTGQVEDGEGCKVSTVIFLPAPEGVTVSGKNIINPVCYNDNNGSITVTVTGGTSPYNLVWDDPSAQKGIIATNLSAASTIAGVTGKLYKLIITDAKGCDAIDSTWLENGVPVTVTFPADSAIVCEGQIVALDAGNPGASYLWESQSKSFSASSKSVNISQSDVYAVTVTDQKGCKGNAVFKLRAEKSFLKSKFLMNTNLQVGDTSMLAEISWPIPEQVDWKLPKAFRIVKQDESHVYIVSDSIGEFKVSLTARMALCTDSMIKTIKVVEKKKLDDGGRFGYIGINTISAYPNPFADELTIETTLTDPMALTYEILSMPYLNKVYSTEQDGHEKSTIKIPTGNLPAGLYIIKVSSPYQYKVIKVIRE